MSATNLFLLSQSLEQNVVCLGANKQNLHDVQCAGTILSTNRNIQSTWPFFTELRCRILWLHVLKCNRRNEPCQLRVSEYGASITIY